MERKRRAIQKLLSKFSIEVYPDPSWMVAIHTLASEKSLSESDTRQEEHDCIELAKQLIDFFKDD